MLVIVKLLDAEAGRLHEDLRQQYSCLAPVQQADTGQVDNRFNCRSSWIRAGVVVVFIALLLDDCGIVRRASVPFGVSQHLVQSNERSKIDMRRSRGHSRAGNWIEHPSRYRNNHTARSLDLCKPAIRSLLNAAFTDLSAKQPMPSVADFQILADMGRMNG